MLGYSLRHIDVVIKEDDSEAWRITGFYGEARNRHLSWELLRRLHNQNNLPWIVFGDFNKILCNEEQRSKSIRPRWQIENFRSVVEECNFHDLGYSGPLYTWTNRRDGDNEVSVRLDRAFVTPNFLQHFPLAQVHHICMASSEHMVITVELAQNHTTTPRRKKRFHFEEHWTTIEDCESIIREAWEVHQGAILYIQCVKNQTH